MDYELVIKNICRENLNNRVIDIELISDTSNKVYRLKMESGDSLYFKFYEGRSFHFDNELKLYDLLNNKYLKNLIYKSPDNKMAIFEELIGRTVDELSYEEMVAKADSIISSVCSYFEAVSETKVFNYGILNERFEGKYNDFHEFLEKRQLESSFILKDYDELTNLFELIYNKYKDIIIADNSLVPIDTNLKNVMILLDGSIKFIDPGEMISGPILMGYGDFVAHIYKTPLYDKLIKYLDLDSTKEKLLRIYAIFSSLNILAFLKKNGVNKLDEIIPYGNTYTFYELIKEHLRYLDLI